MHFEKAEWHNTLFNLEMCFVLSPQGHGRQGQALPWALAPYVMGPAAALQVQGADVSPIDQAVHLGWEWWRVLSVAIQSLLLLKPTRLFRANLFWLHPLWAA